MTENLLFGLAAFAFASSITPGPNNLMLMSSGANFGLRRTLPHMLGVALGFAAMLVLVGLGLARMFEVFPATQAVLLAASLGYLAYLAWKIATQDPVIGQGGAGRPLTFLQAAAFQWVNPKAWAMALSAVSVYAPDRSATSLVVVALIFGAIGLPSVGAWALLGRQIGRILPDRRHMRRFNLAMALLLVASVYPALWP